ncbi:MAG: TrmH family RNA methyltransferase, partial [Clostridia bacterium]
GYVLRTFYAAGVDGVFLPQRNFLSASNIVIRSSAGASELLKIAEYTNPEEVLQKLKQNGICIACTAKEEKSSNLYGAKFKRPVCIVIGGEKRGINKTILSYADKVLKIPYPRELTVSLSASAAASIIAFETARQLAYADKIAESHRQ